MPVWPVLAPKPVHTYATLTDPAAPADIASLSRPTPKQAEASRRLLHRIYEPRAPFCSVITASSCSHFIYRCYRPLLILIRDALIECRDAVCQCPVCPKTASILSLRKRRVPIPSTPAPLAPHPPAVTRSRQAPNSLAHATYVRCLRFPRPVSYSRILITL